MRIAAALASVALLAACGTEPPEPDPEETDVPEELAGAEGAPPAVEIEGATPMADRVATLGVLNKRNNVTEDLELKPGESRRLGNVIVRLSACEQTAPYEMPAETGAFVQVLVRERESAQESFEWRRVFSGWLFARSPSLNVVEHPVYDVWVKDCAMSFPGDAPSSAASESSDA